LQSDTDENYADKVNTDNFDAKSLDSVDQSIGELVSQIEKLKETTNVDGTALSTRREESVDENVAQNGENGQTDVDIVVTSPKGTDTVVKEEAKEENNVEAEKVETSIENNVEKEQVDTVTETHVEKEESTEEEKSEFVNSQGVTFKPTAETVDDCG
jgi:acetolactate synthase regulatory subunit